MTRFFTNLYISILIFCASIWAFNSFFWLIEWPSSLWALVLSILATITFLVFLNYQHIKLKPLVYPLKIHSLALLIGSDLICFGTLAFGLITFSNWIIPFDTPKGLSYGLSLQALGDGWNPLWYNVSNLISPDSNQLWSALPRFSLANYLSLSQVPLILNPGLLLNLLLITAGLSITTLAINRLLPRNLNLVNKYFWRITLVVLISVNPITIRLANSLEVIPQIYALYIIILSSGILLTKKKPNLIHWLTIGISIILLAGISYFGLVVGLLLVAGLIIYHSLNDSLVINRKHILAASGLAVVGLLLNFNPYLPKLLTKLSAINPIGIINLPNKFLGLINQQFNTIIPSLSAMTQSTKEVIYPKVPFLIKNSEITVLKNPNLPLLTSSLGLWFSGIMIIWVIGSGYLYWLTCLKPKRIGDVSLEDQMLIKFHHQKNMTIILIYTIFTVFLITLGLFSRSLYDLNQISFWWLIPCSSIIVWLYFDDAKLDIARQVMTIFLIGNCGLMFWLGLGI